MKIIQFKMRHFTCHCLQFTISLLPLLLLLAPLHLSLFGSLVLSQQAPPPPLPPPLPPQIQLPPRPPEVQAPVALTSSPALNTSSLQIPPAIADLIVKPFLQKTINLGSGNQLAAPNINQPSPTLASPPPPRKKSPQVDPQQSSGSANNYGNEDPISHLDYSSIGDEILRKRTANFVYFNADFNSCRHCHKLYGMWKELAVDIRWWRKLIRLFAINCSEEDNVDVCRRAGVTQFPQIKYYWIMSSSLDQDGQRLRILGKSVHAMRHLIMDRVLESYSEHNKLLAQQQQQSNSAAGLPSPASLGVGQAGGSNPLASLLGPLIVGASGSSGLNSILSALSAAGNGIMKCGGSSTQPSNPLTGLVSGLGGMPGVMQLLGSLTSPSGPLGRRAVQPMPSNWPELDQIEVSDSQQLIGMLPLDPAKDIGALLIMDTQEFLYTGLEVMLDLSPYSNTTYIARVRDERGQLSKNLTKRDDIQAPALIYISGNQEVQLYMTAPKYTNDEDLRRAFVKAFERRRIRYPVKRIWSVGGPNQMRPSDSQEDEEILGKVHQVYMNDLQNALRQSLMEQVFRHPDLSDDQYNALVKYVYALINYFPFKNDESLKFIKRLHTWLQNQVSPMDISEYKKQFHDVDEVFPKRDWIACKSLSNTKSIPNMNRKSSSLFENPSQLGKVVANVSRIFRSQQQQASKLKGMFSVFTASPQKVNNSVMQPTVRTTGKPSAVVGGNGGVGSGAGGGGGAGASVASDLSGGEKREESHIERIIKSLTSGSLGTDSSILKLISTALTGANSADGMGDKSKFAREYPCGAWKLAHVLVVNEYIKDSPRKDVKHLVLHILYQYMMHFYACPACGNRISELQGEFRLNLDDHLVEQGDSVMLLWKMHNRVSKRLESEYRPGSPPKLQFPSESLCPKCRAPRTQNDLVPANWYDKQVLQFLVHHYRAQSIISGTGNPSDSSSSSSSSSSPVTASIPATWYGLLVDAKAVALLLLLSVILQFRLTIH